MEIAGAGSRKGVLVAGICFDAITEDELLQMILDRLDEGHGGHLITPNLSIARAAQTEPSSSLVRQADVRVCDGMPLMWLARMQGSVLPERITGAGLAWSLAHVASLNHRSLFIVGGSDEAVASQAAENLVRAAPGLRIAGVISPPFGFEKCSDRMADFVSTVARSGADIVLVGLGFPKQEIVARSILAAMPGSWVIGCGAAINFAAGAQSRAPLLMQKAGLEWLHRLIAEPTRLAPRYAADAWFAAKVTSRVVVYRLRSTRLFRSIRRVGPPYGGH